MPESNQVGERSLGPLSSLPDKLPSTGIGLVRRLWPKIDAALKAGHNLVAVHESLREGGFDVPYSTLTSCVQRIRLEQARTAPSRAASAKKPLPKVASQPTSVGERDPMANLRKYGTGKVPGFHFTGEPPDPKKLF